METHPFQITSPECLDISSHPCAAHESRGPPRPPWAPHGGQQALAGLRVETAREETHPQGKRKSPKQGHGLGRLAHH